MVYTTYMKTFSSLLFPPFCVCCERSLSQQSSWLCPLCLSRLSFNTHPLCIHCHAFPCTCGHPHLLWAPLVYEEPTRSLIHAYKYRGYEKLGLYLSSLFLSSLCSSFFIPSPATLIPIPPFYTKRLTRTYDHTHLFASHLSGHLALPLFSSLSRTRYTVPQSSLSTSQEKRDNLVSAFSIQGSLPSSVILVDDVVTSGATIQALEKEAYLHGASHVYTYAIALASDLKESERQGI